jgi:ribosomal protein L20A (L18A)
MKSPIPKKIQIEIDKVFKEHKSKIFHYTNVDSLVKIISNGYMYASHIKYLNDWNEFNAGYEKLYQCLIANAKINRSDIIHNNELKFLPKQSPQRSEYYSKFHFPNNDDIIGYYRNKILPDVYAISFCTNGDNLSHWITYAKEAGVSIEFDFNNFVFFDYSLFEKREKLEKKKICLEDIRNVEEFEDSSPRVIKYIDAVDKKISKLLDEIVDSVLDEIENETDNYNIRSVIWSRLSALFSAVPFLKAADFRAEKEVRIAFREQFDTVDKENSDYQEIRSIVQYRVNNNLIIPYLKIGWRSISESTYPIKSITIGPGRNQQAIFQSIIQFIEGQDCSLIPFKGNKSEGFIQKDGSYRTRNGIIIKISKTPYIF